MTAYSEVLNCCSLSGSHPQARLRIAYNFAMRSYVADFCWYGLHLHHVISEEDYQKDFRKELEYLCLHIQQICSYIDKDRLFSLIVANNSCLLEQDDIERLFAEKPVWMADKKDTPLIAETNGNNRLVIGSDGRCAFGGLDTIVATGDMHIGATTPDVRLHVIAARSHHSWCHKVEDPAEGCETCKTLYEKYPE
jgi:hypothetical protein